METDEGSGDYKVTSSNTWPNEDFIFNEALSNCENGSKLTWDSDKKAVIFHGRITDKCYVYFDKKITKILFVDYIKSQYTGTQGENNLYFHDASLVNGAKDNNYRYAGASNTTNNFVCFGSNDATCPTENLYRIIGIFNSSNHGVSNQELIKLIKYKVADKSLLGTDGDYVSSLNGTSLEAYNYYFWNYMASNANRNTWSTSLLNKTNLNTNFLNNVGDEWADKIQEVTWKVGGNTQANIINVNSSGAFNNEIVSPAVSTTYNAKVGMMYVSDYGYAASPSAWTTNLVSYDSSIKSVNWIAVDQKEWTITRRSNDTSGAFAICAGGNVCDGTGTYSYVRPAFYLSSTVSLESGNGTINDPYRIK